LTPGVNPIKIDVVLKLLLNFKLCQGFKLKLTWWEPLETLKKNVVGRVEKVFQFPEKY